MSRCRALAVLVVLGTGLGCVEDRLELIRASVLLPDAGTDATDSGSEPNDAGQTNCEEERHGLGRPFERVAVTAAAHGPIVFGVDAFQLFSVVGSDGGFRSELLVTGVMPTLISATHLAETAAVAFHGPAPSYLLVDLAGVPHGPVMSVLHPNLGANGQWGIRVSSENGSVAVVYRSMSTQGAFTVVSGGTNHRVALPVETGIGHVDGVLRADEVKLLVGINSTVEERLVALDGTQRSARLVTNNATARPFACPGLSVVRTGANVEAVLGDGGSVSLGPGTDLRAVCTPTGALISFVSSSTLAVWAAANSGEARLLFTVPVSTLDDHAIANSGQDVWIVTAPRFESQAWLYRRCLPPQWADGGFVGDAGDAEVELNDAGTSARSYAVGGSCDTSGAPGGSGLSIVVGLLTLWRRHSRQP